MRNQGRIQILVNGAGGALAREVLSAAGYLLVDDRPDLAIVAAGAAAPGRCLAIGDVATGLSVADDVVSEDRIRAELVARVDALFQKSWRPSVARSLRLVAHDLNNPLGAARILAELLRSDLQDPDMRRDADDLLVTVDHAALQVETLTFAARAVDPTRPWRPDRVDLTDLVRKAVKRPGLKGATLREPAASVQVTTDAEALGGAITELLLLGRKLGPGGERCEVVVATNPARLEVRSARANGTAWFPRALRPEGAAAVRETDRVPLPALGLTVCAALAAHGGVQIEVAEEAQTTITRLVWA